MGHVVRLVPAAFRRTARSDPEDSMDSSDGYVNAGMQIIKLMREPCEG